MCFASTKDWNGKKCLLHEPVPDRHGFVIAVVRLCYSASCYRTTLGDSKCTEPMREQCFLTSVRFTVKQTTKMPTTAVKMHRALTQGCPINSLRLGVAASPSNRKLSTLESLAADVASVAL